MKVHDITRAVALGEYLQNGEGLAKQERNGKNIQSESLFSHQKASWSGEKRLLVQLMYVFH